MREEEEETLIVSTSRNSSSGKARKNVTWKEKVKHRTIRD
jgi:hypothetical protein